MSDTLTAHTLTLSRWHAVADRIRASAMVQQREAIQILGNTQLSHAPTGEQKEALQARGQRALGLVSEARLALQVVGTIREALAQKNANEGVSQLLSQTEAKRQEAKFLGELGNIDLLTRVGLNHVEAALEKRPEPERPVYHARPTSSGVPVTLVAVTALDEFQLARRLLDAEVSALTDRINDLNRATLTLEIPKTLAVAAGLAK